MAQTQQVEKPATATPTAVKRRRRWPWILGGILFVLFAVVLVAPRLLSGWAAGKVSESFSEQHRGKLEVSDVRLAWFSRQHVRDARLLDEHGVEIARASIELPPLIKLATGGGKRIGLVQVTATADLVADDAGVSNLQRALEETHPAKPKSKPGGPDDVPPDLGALMRQLDVQVVLSVPHLTWSDARTRQIGKSFEVRDLAAEVVAKPGEPQAVTVTGKLASQNDAPLSMSAKLYDLFDAKGINAKARFEMRASVAEFPSGLVDALAAQDGLVTAVLGDRFKVDAAGDGTLESGKVKLDVAGDGGTLHAQCALKDGVLQGTQPRALELKSKLEPAAVARLLAAKLPAGFQVTRSGDAPIEIALSDLRVDVKRIVDASADESNVLVESALNASQLTATASLGSWHVAGDSLGTSGVEVGDLSLELSVTPGDGASKVAAKLRSSALDASLAGSVTGGVWRGERNDAEPTDIDGTHLGEPRALTATLKLPAALVADLSKRFLPATAQLETASALQLGAFRLEFPVQPPPDDAGFLSQLTAVAAVDLDSVRYVDRSADREKKIELRKLRAVVTRVAPIASAKADDRASVRVAASLGADSAGDFSLAVNVDDASALTQVAEKRALAPVAIVLSAHKVPTALIEAWSGASGKVSAVGESVDIEATGNLSIPKGAAAKASLTAMLSSPSGTCRLKLDGGVAEPFALGDKFRAGVLPEFDVRIGVEGLALADAFLPASAAAAVHGLAGDKLDAKIACRGDKPNEAGLDCEITAERIELSTNARIADRVLHIEGDDSLHLKVRPTAALLDRYAGPSLPQGAKLAFVDAEPLLEMHADRVQLPLDAWMPAADAQPASLSDVLRRTAARVDLALPAMRYEQPALDAASAAVPISLESLAVLASLQPTKPASVDVSGLVSGAQGGKIELHAKCADVGALLETKPDAALPAFDIDGELANIPTALVDAIAAQKGLLVDTLGPSIDVKLHGAIGSATAQPLTATFKSANASLDLVAHAEAKTLVAKDAEGLKATVPLTPAFSQRVVGKLVPLLVNASKPAGTAPVALQVSNFTLPLDGDLHKIDGVVKLDLGEVVYDLLPGFDGLLQAAGLDKISKQSARLDPIEVVIKKGIARYESLPLTIAGERTIFKGTYDIPDAKFDFTTELPLKLLGSGALKQLDKVRDNLDPNMLVPIEIKGTWSKPRVSIGDGFIEKVLKDAAGDALKGGLEDLLGGGKKKKKD